MDNQNQLFEFIGEFKAEIITYIDEVNDLLLKLNTNNKDKENLNELFRKIHTIKGMSGFIGFNVLSFISDKLEECLIKCRAKEIEFNNKIFDFSKKYCTITLIIINDINLEKDMKFNKLILENFNIDFDMNLLNGLDINLNSSKPVRESRESNFKNKLKMMLDAILEKVELKPDLHFNIDEIDINKNKEDKILQMIMHIIRNSLSHGIENSDIRLKNGKMPEGNLYLDLNKYSSKVIIEVEDDGKGIDLLEVLNRAKSLELIDSNRNYTSDDLLGFIFEPGFTTKEKSDTLSGRGVGLDFVKKTVTDLEGKIDVINKSGFGTKFVIEIPII